MTNFIFWKHLSIVLPSVELSDYIINRERVIYLFSHVHYLPQIVHWRNHLKFPEESRLTPEAKDLICRLLCDVDHRLGTRGADQIKVCHSFYCSIWPYNFLRLYVTLISIYVLQSHPWFKDVVWDKLYEMDAAFKPEVNGELDTQNFMKFDDVCSF